MPQENKQTSSTLLQTERQALGDKITVSINCQSALGTNATEFGWGGQETENKTCCLLTTFGSESLSILSDSLFMDLVCIHSNTHTCAHTHTHTHKCEKREKCFRSVCVSIGSIAMCPAPPCSLSLRSRDTPHPGGLCEEVSVWVLGAMSSVCHAGDVIRVVY